jgi:hypothetical protein
MLLAFDDVEVPGDGTDDEDAQWRDGEALRLLRGLRLVRMLGAGLPEGAPVDLTAA